MIAINRRFAIVFGICATVVSLCSGCATQPDPRRLTMHTDDLNYFKVDCRRKEEQIALLQSLRVSANEQFEAGMRMTLKPYEAVTNPQVYQSNRDTALGNPNKYINFHLRTLREC